MTQTKRSFFIICLSLLIGISMFSNCTTASGVAKQATKQGIPVMKGSAVHVTDIEQITTPMRLAGPTSNGFPCVRIPAIVKAPNGDLLAFWDGRTEGCVRRVAIRPREMQRR